jgi:SulP family sulfate permease
MFVLLFMAVAAPLAVYVPLAALAGVLAMVAWNMVERSAFMALVRSSPGDALVLVVTFGLVVLRDLTTGIVVGFALGALLFINRMAHAVAVEAHVPTAIDDVPDMMDGDRQTYDASEASDPDTVVYRISGAFFFGAAATVGTVLDRIADKRRNFVLDCSKVPFLDSTAANIIAGAARKASRAGVGFYIAGASPAVRRMLLSHGVRRPHVRYGASVGSVLEHIRRQVTVAGPA